MGRLGCQKGPITTGVLFKLFSWVLLVGLSGSARSAAAEPVGRRLLQPACPEGQNLLDYELLIASILPSARRVRRLVRCGARISIQDENGWTPLHYAAASNSAVVAEFLLSIDAVLDPRTEHYHSWMNMDSAPGSTPLHLAAVYGSDLTAQVLLSAGAQCNAPDKDGDTPLHVAAFHKQLSTAQVLYNAGVDINARNFNGWTPLYLAARFGLIESVNFLLERGADSSIPDHFGAQPIGVVCSGNQECTSTRIAELTELLRQ